MAEVAPPRGNLVILIRFPNFSTRLRELRYADCDALACRGFAPVLSILIDRFSLIYRGLQVFLLHTKRGVIYLGNTVNTRNAF